MQNREIQERRIEDSLTSDWHPSTQAISELLPTAAAIGQHHGDPNKDDTVIILRALDYPTLDLFKSEYQRCDRPALCVLPMQYSADFVPHLRETDEIAVEGEPDSVTQWRMDRITKAHARRLDPLTKVFRRGQLIQSLTAKCWSADDSNPVSLILLDVDHLKTINDESGPRVGDRVLCQLGELLRSLCRQTLVARTRGGEFAIMAQANEATTKKIALIIQNEINTGVWSEVNKITGSFGIATVTMPCEPSVLLTRTDEALFAAKANGRNRVTCYSEIAALSNRDHDEIAVVSMENKARVLSERVTNFVTQRSKRIMKSLRKEANTDGLTDLFNRRYLDKQLAEEFKLAFQSGNGLCIALADLDHFGEVNKKHGWPTGDKVLRAVAKTIMGSIRASDWVGRYGGEEICIVMPGTSLEAAIKACERIRNNVDLGQFESTSASPVAVTLSIGVVEFTPDDHDISAMLERVSQLTLKAKTSGRNQVRDQ
ncbi:MAG: GGDEF domain-containing protein [Mariniblastus sp.]